MNLEEMTFEELLQLEEDIKFEIYRRKSEMDMAEMDFAKLKHTTLQNNKTQKDGEGKI
jgi:hypothetical protein